MPKKAEVVESVQVETGARKQSAIDPGIILQLDPNIILADDNTRYNLKESRISTLADSIVAQGGVIEPVEVEPLPDGSNNGFQYRLTLGFYRHAAVKHLNTTQAAGLTLPAIVHINESPMDRLKRQMAENIERENQSPMDIAVGVKRLMDAGTPRIDIRTMFSRPTGTKKGGKVQPASNSFINMMLSFLELPKAAQEKIHTGVVGVKAAYQLTKVPKEKQAEILDKAEAERKKELEQEEKEEERFLTGEKKAAEKREALETAQKELAATETKNTAAAEALEKQTTLVTDLFKVSKGKFDIPKDKKAADTAFREAEKVRLALETKATEVQKEYEKAQVAYSKLTEEHKAAKKEAAAQAPKASKGISQDEVKKAAKESGVVGPDAVPLTAKEMRDVISAIGLPGGDREDTKLKQLSDLFKDCFAGVTTPETLIKGIRKLFSGK